MKLVGLTGGIACGKSTVSRMLRDEGITVVDCDQISHDVMAKVVIQLRRELPDLVRLACIYLSGYFAVGKVGLQPCRLHFWPRRPSA